MQALGAKVTVAPTRWRVVHPRQQQVTRNKRRIAALPRAASMESKSSSASSRRDVLLAPGFAALVSATEQLWLPGAAEASKIIPTNVSATDVSTAIAGAHVGPLGGAVGVKDYKAFEKVIYGFINGIKTGECPPWAKNTSRAFLLKEEGGNRAMLTILLPTADVKQGLPFFIESGPKANPLWAESNETWKDPDVPIFATGSEAFLIRGEVNAQKSCKGKVFGQYQFGYNGKVDDWADGFTSPPANDFHNSVGIEFSVAHKLDLKTPGNTYKTKAKNGIEVFHCFNSVEGAKEFSNFFQPDAPAFANEPKYVGPFTQTIWKVVDDINYV